MARLSHPIDPTVSNYEFLQRVDDLAPDVGGLRLGDAQFVRLTPALLREWNLWQDPPLRPSWKGLLALRTPVTAESGDVAIERGRAIVDGALSELRYGLQSHLRRAYLGDWQLQFASGWWAVRAVDGEPKLKWAFDRPSQSRQRWDRVHLEAALAATEPIRVLRKSRPRLGKPVDMALAWLSLSRLTAPEVPAYLALFAALEAVLHPDRSGRKGERLAFRFMLLEDADRGGLQDPAELLALYERRSELIHGQSAAFGDHMHRSAQSVASSAIRLFVGYCADRPELTSHTAVMKSLEESDRAPKALAWLQRNRPKLARRLIRAEAERQSRKRPRGPRV